MKTVETSRSPSLPARGKPLSTVVIYEDLPARLRMKKLLWMLSGKFSPERDFECFWCGFDDLKNSAVASNARMTAVQADLILFSVNETEPPESVKAWVESWIELKAAHDAGLAALLNKGDRAGRPETSGWKYLNRIAQRVGMSFLPEIMRIEPLCEPS